MSHTRHLSLVRSLPLSTLSTIEERRAQVRDHEARLQSERRQALDAQSSPLNSVIERIRIWESLHSLKLPRAANHKLLAVIAAQTELTLEQVQEEQQRRAADAPNVAKVIVAGP